jgi:Flp pilus assembly protein CpaB
MVLVVLVFVLIFVVTFILNQNYIKKNTDLVNVLVAVKKIPAFSSLTVDQVALAKRPRVVVPREAVLDVSTLFSEKTYYVSDLGFGIGDIIRLDRLSNEDTKGIGKVSSLGEENMMLISINTNLVKSCANLVVPGTLVNAIVFVKGQMLDEPDRIISPAEDLSLANLLVVDKKNAEATIPTEKGREAIPAVVTLIIEKDNLEIAKALVQYNETGSIYLLPVGFESNIYLASEVRKQQGEKND